MNLARLKEGEFTRKWMEWDEDFEEDFQRKESVTAEVRELVFAYEIEVKRANTLSKELSDLKTRKWWDEVEVFTDRATHNQVVVRTHYQLEMKTMRMEMGAEQFRMMR